MTAHISPMPSRSRAAALAALLVSGLALAGCADMSDNLTSAFADPAKYDLYECKQLEGERKSLATRTAETQGLIAKAQTGAAGPVVAELAYRNEYIALRAQSRLADEAWRRNNCRDGAPNPAAPPVPPSAANIRNGQPPLRSGNAVY